MRTYDYIIVGAGLFGSVFAAEAVRSGKSVLVLDKRSHIGGFCDSYPCPITGIEVHRYGTHVFHTNDRSIWEWMHQYTEFHPYKHRVMAQTAEGRVFELPVNLDTFERFRGQKLSPSQVAQDSDRAATSSNFETVAIARLGRDLYEALVQGYTQKQWGCAPSELPASIFQRLSIYTRYHSGYFNDLYQGVPERGYGMMFRRMLEGADVQLYTTVGQADLDNLRTRCRQFVWTGPIDSFYDCSFGRLGWRSVELKTQVLQEDDHQGCAQMNYTSALVPWTRKHEPKHFRLDRWVKGQTVVQTEFAGDDAENPAYPIRRPTDLALVASYKAKADLEAGVIFGGRLASYAYFDMHQVVAQALHASRR